MRRGDLRARSGRAACFAIAAVLSLAPGCLGEQSSDLIISNVTVLTLAADGVLENRHVLVRDGVVEELAAERKELWPVNAEVVDGSGRFLMPALYDLHVHIFDERDLEVYALMGVATVRNMDGWGWHLDLRDAWQPEAWRARLVTTGAQYQRPLVGSAKSIARQVEREAGQGFDWIKAYDGLGRESLEALAVASSRHGMPVTGHLPDDLPATDALATGAFADVAHAEELLAWYRGLPSGMEDGVRLAEPQLDQMALAFKEHRTALVTSLVSYFMIMDQLSDLEANLSRSEVGLAAPMIQVFWRSRFNPYAGGSGGGGSASGSDNKHLLQQLVADLGQRGVVLLAGTDAPNPTTVPADSLYTELELLVEAGFTPEDAIRAATTAAADHLGRTSDGRVQVGAKADFLLLEGNPLEDISQLRQRAGVVLAGRYLSSNEIAARLREQRRTYAAEVKVLEGFDPASPSAILEAIDGHSANAGPPVSAAALTSLVWIYSKFGNPTAAESIARLLVRLYPGARSERILGSQLAPPQP